MNLIKLAERVEAGEASEQRELLSDAWDALGPINKWDHHDARYFGMMIDAGAYESAAMMMVPEGDDVSGEIFRLEAYNKSGVLADHVRASAWVPGAPRAFAATPALALCAAALRAKAGEG